MIFNISPTIQVGILIKPFVTKNILLGTYCTSKEIATYKEIFQEFNDMFAWNYTKMTNLKPAIMEQYIDTCLKVSLVHQK